MRKFIKFLADGAKKFNKKLYAVDWPHKLPPRSNARKASQGSGRSFIKRGGKNKSSAVHGAQRGNFLKKRVCMLLCRGRECRGIGKIRKPDMSGKRKVMRLRAA